RTAHAHEDDGCYAVAKRVLCELREIIGFGQRAVVDAKPAKSVFNLGWVLGPDGMVVFPEAFDDALGLHPCVARLDSCGQFGIHASPLLRPNTSLVLPYDSRLVRQGSGFRQRRCSVIRGA